MSDRAFLRMTELAAVASPEGDAETRAVLAARKVLGAYARNVVSLAADRDPGQRPSSSPAASASAAADACPLREDAEREGLPDGAALELAPEVESRLLLVPRVL